MVSGGTEGGGMTDFDPPAPEGFVVHEGVSHKCHPCESKTTKQCQELGPCCAPDRPDGRWVYFTRVETKGLD